MAKLRIVFNPDSKIEPDEIDPWELQVLDNHGSWACVASSIYWATVVAIASDPPSSVLRDIAYYRSLP